jgi:hypothetical protein
VQGLSKDERQGGKMKNKKTWLIIVITAAVIITSQGCGRQSSPGPTPTPNLTPLATLEIDNFEDGDLINSVQPIDAFNTWYSVIKPNSNCNNGLTGGQGGDYGADAYGTTSNLIANVATPTGYYGYTGMITQTITNFGAGTGLNLSQYTNAAFAMHVSVTAQPLNGSLKYGLKLRNPSGYYADCDFTPFIELNSWKNYSLPLSSFQPPAGAPYSVADVLPDVNEITFYYYIFSGVQNTTAGLEACIDNVQFIRY